LQWDNADYDGHEQARAIESAIEFARERLSDLSDDLQEKIDDGIAACAAPTENTCERRSPSETG